MRHICHIEAHITLWIRYFNTTCHHATSIERLTCRICNGYSVNNKKIVMKTLRERVCNTTPFTVGIADKIVFAA